MFSHVRYGFIHMLCLLVHIPLYQCALANSKRSGLRLLISFSCLELINFCGGEVVPFLKSVAQLVLFLNS